MIIYGQLPKSLVVVLPAAIIACLDVCPTVGSLVQTIR